MKALSLKQPFAELVVSGRKTIELRNWNTFFRGDFLIHASQKPDAQAMKKFGFSQLPCGFLVGKATLVTVKEYANKIEHQSDQARHLANSDWGNYGFILEKIQRIKPIPVKGHLGFWDFNDNVELLRD